MRGSHQTLSAPKEIIVKGDLLNLIIGIIFNVLKTSMSYVFMRAQAHPLAGWLAYNGL